MNTYRKTAINYILGFIFSVLLTLEAYYMVTRHEFGQVTIVVAILVLAIIQLGVQLIFFLHLHQEKKPRWNLAAFGFMAIIVLILVLGSLWIMYSLNYHHKDLFTPNQVNTYLQSQDGI